MCFNEEFIKWHFVTAAYNKPFRKHNLNHCEDTLMAAFMECRNT
jgi:hypothetical protein